MSEQQPIKITINGETYEAGQGLSVLNVINLAQIQHPQICYVPEVDPIQTCDTCIVEIDGQLARACSTTITEGMNVQTNSTSAKAAQTEGMDRLLENHMLYCTVCDNNNGNCKLIIQLKKWVSNIRNILSNRKSLQPKSICLIRSIAMIPISVSLVGNV